MKDQVNGQRKLPSISIQSEKNSSPSCYNRPFSEQAQASASIALSSATGLPFETVFFGKYKQRAGSPGEPIEWIILEKKKTRFLVISKYGLSSRKFHKNHKQVTWEKCSLRKWLNSDFLDTAFDEKERDRILTTLITADRNPEFSTPPGNDTEDRVFLLSAAEALKYAHPGSILKCVPTEISVREGAFIKGKDSADRQSTCWWWLRSPGLNPSFAAIVDFDGLLNCTGDYADVETNLVRPALWIDMRDS